MTPPTPTEATCKHLHKRRFPHGASECADCGARFQWTMDAYGNSEPKEDIIDVPPNKTV